MAGQRRQTRLQIVKEQEGDLDYAAVEGALAAAEQEEPPEAMRYFEREVKCVLRNKWKAGLLAPGEYVIDACIEGGSGHGTGFEEVATARILFVRLDKAVSLSDPDKMVYTFVVRVRGIIMGGGLE